MLLHDIGVIGMAVMGQNLALNIEKNGYSVSIFNRTKKRTNDFISKHVKKKLFPFFSIKKLISSLKRPRLVLLMIQSGKATDEIISLIKKYLDKGDVIIDGGNSFYKDTIRRCQTLKKHRIYFVGAGISGGEEGALNGPSIMFGGDKKAYLLTKKILKNISAKFHNSSCLGYIGQNGSGHYLKMIHNGIEYANMELIAESYFLLKNYLHMDNKKISKIFSKWNRGKLNSYLMDITKRILKKKDNKGNFLLDLILDVSENKGTGSWMSKSALDLNAPSTLVTSSVFSRYLSSIKNQRLKAAELFVYPIVKKKIYTKYEKERIIRKIKKSLYLANIISYAQGFSQLRKASKIYGWNLKYEKIAKIFRSGCIIRCSLLEEIIQVYHSFPEIKNLLLSSYFSKIVNQYQKSLREVVLIGIRNGIALPVLSTAVSYYDAYRTENSSANLIQAQRDYFGAHTYKRIDKKGYFHTFWNSF